MASSGGEEEALRLRAERVFIGAGCNRVVHNASWGPSGLVSFGTNSAVAVFSPESAQILTTLPGHKVAVNCTQWIPSCKDAHKVQHAKSHFLLSGSADGVILLWEYILGENKWKEPLQAPAVHKKGVTCIAGIVLSQNVMLFASSSSDGTVFVWEVVVPANSGDCKISLLDSIFVGLKPMVALSFMELIPHSGNVLLAMGGLDHKVHIFSGDRVGKFNMACELKGHTDWIRSLDFSLPISTSSGKYCFFLVSSSQDRTIRIWKMESHFSSSNSEPSSRKVDVGLTSYIEGSLFVVGPTTYQVSLESLLVGHEDWVYSVRWQPPQPSMVNGGEYHQPLSILSASMDKTMMVWRPERTTGIWLNVVTVGELCHSALGFFGGHWAPDGQSILAHGYGGSFHLWKNTGTDYENWLPQKVPSGHFSAVSDIAWSRFGEYVLSVSHDQTSRIFAPWEDDAIGSGKAFWFEIARPQVHGHDMNCVAIVGGSAKPQFVSGADEKVARVFETPLSFLKTLNHAIHQNSESIEGLSADTEILGAHMSALGLSQKPLYVNCAHDGDQKDALDSSEMAVPDAMPTALIEPPIEEQLAWHTLWPETCKLYGHGNDLFSLCCNHKGKLVASACKAQSASVAEIWLWEVGSWKAVGHLRSHDLTITQMEFSHDDAYLLAVSRDRQFSVFSVHNSGNEMSFQLVAKQEAHRRIIWACSWNPFRNEFATGSRDKTVKIWSVVGASVELLVALPAFKDGVTALSWAGHKPSRNSGLLAVGMESGLIELWGISGHGPCSPRASAALAMRFDPFMCHASTVHRLAWSDPASCFQAGAMKLASCGADHCVRVFLVSVDTDSGSPVPDQDLKPID